MGLARDLTMGPKKPRSRIGMTGDYALLRRMIREDAPDVEAMRAAIRRVAATPTRLRFAEGAVYNAACKRFRELTGEKVGPETAYR